MIGNKIAEKITSRSKKPVKKLYNNNDNKTEDVELTTNKKETYHQKKDNKLLMS